MTPEPESETGKLRAACAQASRLNDLLWLFCEWHDADLSDRDFVLAIFERYKRYLDEHIGDPSR